MSTPTVGTGGTGDVSLPEEGHVSKMKKQLEALANQGLDAKKIDTAKKANRISTGNLPAQGLPQTAGPQPKSRGEFPPQIQPKPEFVKDLEKQIPSQRPTASPKPKTLQEAYDKTLIGGFRRDKPPEAPKPKQAAAVEEGALLPTEHIQFKQSPDAIANERLRAIVGDKNFKTATPESQNAMIKQLIKDTSLAVSIRRSIVGGHDDEKILSRLEESISKTYADDLGKLTAEGRKEFIARIKNEVSEELPGLRATLKQGVEKFTTEISADNKLIEQLGKYLDGKIKL